LNREARGSFCTARARGAPCSWGLPFSEYSGGCIGELPSPLQACTRLLKRFPGRRLTLAAAGREIEAVAALLKGRSSLCSRYRDCNGRTCGSRSHWAIVASEISSTRRLAPRAAPLGSLNPIRRLDREVGQPLPRLRHLVLPLRRCARIGTSFCAKSERSGVSSSTAGMRRRGLLPAPTRDAPPRERRRDITSGRHPRPFPESQCLTRIKVAGSVELSSPRFPGLRASAHPGHWHCRCSVVSRGAGVPMLAGTSCSTPLRVTQPARSPPPGRLLFPKRLGSP
jgi:hypothetical protein